MPKLGIELSLPLLYYNMLATVPNISLTNSNLTDIPACSITEFLREKI
jgi:hypothetical protein